MEPRTELVSSLKLEHGTALEFNFDLLWAPSINQLMTPTQVGDLYELATSIEYNAKVKTKYKCMDQIMAKSGFRQFHAGTNRRIYQHPDFQQLMSKVSIDDSGLKDSPAEYRNQSIYAPYCTKIFDVSPKGNIGFVERFEPILTREMFDLYKEDIFYIIDNVIDGRYAVADIGTLYFMNWGIRPGFGPGLLDFPYAYKLDGNKLYCRAVLPDNSICTGTIDYDRGFNELICNHCGKVYQARDLELAVENKEINLQGGISMELKMQVMVGDTVVFDNRGDIDTTDSLEPTKPVKRERRTTPKINVEIGGTEAKKQAFLDQAEEDRKKEEEKRIKRLQTFNEKLSQGGLSYERDYAKTPTKTAPQELTAEESKPVETALADVIKEFKESENKKDETITQLKKDKEELIKNNEHLVDYISKANNLIHEMTKKCEGLVVGNKNMEDKLKQSIKFNDELKRSYDKKQAEIDSLKEAIENNHDIYQDIYDEFEKKMEGMIPKPSIDWNSVLKDYVCPHCGMIMKGRYNGNCPACNNKLFSLAQDDNEQIIKSFIDGEMQEFEDALKEQFSVTDFGMDTLMEELHAIEKAKEKLRRDHFSHRTAITDVPPKMLTPDEVEEIVEERKEILDTSIYSKFTSEDAQRILHPEPQEMLSRMVISERIVTIPEPSQEPEEKQEDIKEEQVSEISKLEEVPSEPEVVIEEKKEEPPKSLDLSNKKKGDIVKSNLQEDSLAEGKKNYPTSKKSRKERKKDKQRQKQKGQYVNY